jgi:hypothetical protein
MLAHGYSFQFSKNKTIAKSLRMPVFIKNTKANGIDNGIWVKRSASYFHEHAKSHTHKMRSRASPHDSANMAAAAHSSILF